MPNIRPLELVVVLIIALVVLGPKRLPDVRRSVGEGMREFKHAISGDHEKDDEPAPLVASDYYGFAAQTLVACGIVSQVPVGVLALTRLGVVTPKKLRAWRRYAVMVNAVIAMALPGVDPVSMLLELLPLLALYEISILVSAAFGKPYESIGVEPSDARA